MNCYHNSYSSRRNDSGLLRLYKQNVLLGQQRHILRVVVYKDCHSGKKKCERNKKDCQ